MMHFSSAFFVVLFAFVVPTYASLPSAPIPPTAVPTSANATAAAAAAVETALATLHSKAASPTTRTVAGSFVGVSWSSAGSLGCARSTETVTITCGSGGAIFFQKSFGSPTCNKVGSSTLKCTRSPYETGAVVVFSCQNSKVLHASLPSKTFLNCQKSDGSHLAAYQAMAMQIICDAITVQSVSCGGGSNFVNSSGTPVCLSKDHYCRSTSSHRCSIFVAGVLMSANYC